LTEQITHRSRVGTISTNYGLLTDNNYKIATYKALIEKVDPIDSTIEKEMYVRLLGGMRRCIDANAFPAFQAEHKNASINGLYKWRDLDPDDAQVLVNFWRARIDWELENIPILDKVFFDIDWRVGTRARTTTKFNKEMASYIEDLNRTRWIYFNEYCSTANAVVDHERFAKIKLDEMDNWRKQTGLEAYQATMDGVSIYTTFDEMRTKPYKAMDVISFELWLVALMKWLGYTAAQISDSIRMLASGDWKTALSAVLFALAQFRSEPNNDKQILIGSGDDQGRILKEPGVEIKAPVFVEEDVMDSKLRFLLGLSYAQEVAHPIGIKLTVDSSDAHQPYEEPITTLYGKHTEQEIEVTSRVYQGFVGTVPFIDYLRMHEREFNKMDWFSPRQLLQKVIDNGVQEQSGPKGELPTS
jgi:hypothetical protein